MDFHEIIKILLRDCEDYLEFKPRRQKFLLKLLIIIFRILFYGGLLVGWIYITIKLDEWGYNNGHESLGPIVGMVIPMILMGLRIAFKVLFDEGPIALIVMIVLIIIAIMILNNYDISEPVRMHRIRFHF